MELNKDHSKAMYGIAITMMIYHHLFCIPQRLNCDYFSLLGEAELNMAWLCKICVAIFAFISGYGLYRSSRSKNEQKTLKRIAVDYKLVIRQFFKFMKKYWLVFAIFVPMGHFLKYIDINTGAIIRGIAGFSAEYNREWWYVKTYIAMLAIFPLINEILFSIKDGKRAVFVTAAVLIIIIGAYFLKHRIELLGLIIMCINKFNGTYLYIFIIGIICSKYKVFEYIVGRLKNSVAIVLFVISVLLRFIMSSKAPDMIDIFIIVPFIYGLVRLLDKFKGLSLCMQKIGTHSTYMWLTHTFFCYYYFQKIITFSKISTVMFIETFIISYITAEILMYIERRLNYKFG